MTGQYHRHVSASTVYQNLFPPKCTDLHIKLKTLRQGKKRLLSIPKRAGRWRQVVGLASARSAIAGRGATSAAVAVRTARVTLIQGGPAIRGARSAGRTVRAVGRVAVGARAAARAASRVESDVRKDSHCGLPVVKLRGWFSSKSKRLVDGITESSFMKAVRGHLAF